MFAVFGDERIERNMKEKINKKKLVPDAAIDFSPIHFRWKMIRVKRRKMNENS